MGVSIAEYFGQRTDISTPIIMPVTKDSQIKKCPFMNKDCAKLSRGLKPVCSVRKRNGDIWIVCRDRLCSTNKTIPLTSYQKDILLAIAKEVFSPEVKKEHILIKREARIPVVGKSSYNADYIMSIHNFHIELRGPKHVVLEMQGGGETSNTGSITRHIDTWEMQQGKTNAFLAQEIDAGTIETNAWRRQQEQFIIKGNIASQTGGGIVFCVGSPLYDYLWQRVCTAKLNNLRHHNWSMCLICIDEDKSKVTQVGSISLKINTDKILFTNYITFMQTLINQGEPYPAMFAGAFETLDGKVAEIGS
ncbi:MAG: restriction endonuclease [Oscillospiraceae bacterium]|nr:restriction endonuclease [Oscillospiraceae bacterium]